jgi:STE24 endopeptidase
MSVLTGPREQPSFHGGKLVLAAAFVFLALFALTSIPSTAAEEQARAEHFTEQEIEKGLHYAFEGRLISWGLSAVLFAFWTFVVLGGWGRKLADACGRLSGNRWLLTVLLVGAACLLAQSILTLPFGLASLARQHAWGMSRQSVIAWLADFGKSIAVTAVTGGVLLVGLYLLLRYFPRGWWALAAAGGTAFAIAYAFLMPVLIDPLFYHFHSLEDAQLQKQVTALAEKAGVQVSEVLVMDASRKGRHTNAYFTGFGPTRRIVLYDTLLKNHTPAEIESILAHEIGHWQHNHILKGILLGGVGACFGFFLLAQILRWAVDRRPFLLSGPADPAGLPLIVLLISVGGFLALPAQNAVSRHFERQADETSLKLADHPDDFIAAEKRLARDNLSNLAPNPLSVWLFYTHPPALERIRMAEEWKQKRNSPKR